MLIALDLSEMDNRLMNYINAMLKSIAIKRLSFIYIEKPPKVPFTINETNIQSDAENKSHASLLKEQIDKYLNQHLNISKETERELFVETGSPAVQILRWIDTHKPDLLIVGRKDISKGSGITAGRIVRKSSCSVLLVPEKETSSFENILVPVDFSISSTHSIKEAYRFASELNGGYMICQHVYYHPPTLNLRLNRSPREFQSIVKNKFDGIFKEYFKRNNIPEEKIIISLVEDKKNKPARAIVKYAKKHRMDMIIMGANGQSKHELIHLGSITERIIAYNYTIPLLVIKEKG